MSEINWCDCGYIAPEVRRAGHVCVRCQAIVVASELSDNLLHKVAYLHAKGVPGFTPGDIAGLADLTNRLDEMLKQVGKVGPK